MTTLKEIFDMIDILPRERFGPPALDIGDYTFTDVDHNYEFFNNIITNITKFTQITNLTEKQQKEK